MTDYNPKKSRRWVRYALYILIIAVIIVGVQGFVLQTEEYELHFSDLPAAFDGYRIAVISDLHGAQFGRDNERLIEAVRATEPDMIAVTGDLTDDAKEVPSMLEAVRRLAEIAPTYYITGNHEWEDGGVHELFAGLPQVGATVLRNEIVPIERDGEVIYLVGLEDRNGPADMEKPESVFARLDALAGESGAHFDADSSFGEAMQHNIENEIFNVVLIHRNSYLSRLAPLGADLILCGHAHGGLIRLPFTDGLIDHSFNLFPTHTNGVYTEGATTMLVSRGIGNGTGVPRIFNAPHIPVAILRREV